LRFKGLEEIVIANLDLEAKEQIEKAYKEVELAIENLEFKTATDRVMELVEYANKYYDESKPWIQRKEDEEGFNNTIYTCAVIIANLSNLFEPFMPVASKKIREYLNIKDAKWEFMGIEENIKLDNIEPLFNRI